jgi:hypothetical protein
VAVLPVVVQDVLEDDYIAGFFKKKLILVQNQKELDSQEVVNEFVAVH